MMDVKGVCYDVGRVMTGANWRPRLDLTTVKRELEIIKNDLHANAVRICGLDIERLVMASDVALSLGLEVWFSPEMWDSPQEETLKYLVKAAKSAEELRLKWGDHIVFSVGSELTLFMQGIVEGTNVFERLSSPSLRESVKSGRLDSTLNKFLDSSVHRVKEYFLGPLTYFSVPLEKVNWDNFDYVGVDLYRDDRIREIFGNLTSSYLKQGKPLIIGETGCCTYQGAEKLGGTGFVIAFGMMESYFKQEVETPKFGGEWLEKVTKVDGHYVRDEALQAREIVEQLDIFNSAGASGAFVYTFVTPTSPFNPDPRCDLDMAGFSLVKSYPEQETVEELIRQSGMQGKGLQENESLRKAIISFIGEIGGHGETYPDMTWEPKESFRSVAKYFAGH